MRLGLGCAVGCVLTALIGACSAPARPASEPAPAPAPEVDAAPAPEVAPAPAADAAPAPVVAAAPDAAPPAQRPPPQRPAANVPALYACTTAADCVLSCPKAPKCCGFPCGCKNAIARSQQAAFEADYAKNCQRPPCPAVGCAREDAMGVACRNGRCVGTSGPGGF